MRKKNYSLTAKERKELRLKKLQKEMGKVPQAESEPEVAEASGSVKFNAKQIAIATAAGVVALMCFFMAVVLPFFFGPYRDVENTVAKIALSNGMVLEFEIYENDCPTAATNFIWLAKNKFFDGTIIYDNSNGWVRFGDYVNAETCRSDPNNKDNEAYYKTLTGIYPNHATKPFGYRLKKDSGKDVDRYGECGMLTFDYSNSSCRFFISAKANAQTRIDGRDYTPAAFGRYLNDSTLKNIEDLASLENSPLKGGSRWNCPSPFIRIEKVELFNLKSEKWDNFHFENFMEDVTGTDEKGNPISGSNTVVSGWGYTYQE